MSSYSNSRNWLWTAAVAVLCTTWSVSALALGIGVGREPAPPAAIVNDGTESELYNWEIQFDSTPDHYVEFILDPDGDVVQCVFHDLIGWNPTPPAPWDLCVYSDEHLGWPQDSPIVGQSSWLAPFGAKLGRYEIRIQYYSIEGGEPWEAEGAVTFYVAQATGSLKLEKFHDLNGNGLKDAGEPGLATWKISFEDPFGTVFHRLTGLDGTVAEPSVPVGSYVVWETLKPGWINTTPLLTNGAVITEQQSEFVFGNHETGSIGDTVWFDDDKDGVFDPEEEGISGVVLHLFIDGNNDGVFETYVGDEITNQGGWYLFD